MKLSIKPSFLISCFLVLFLASCKQSLEPKAYVQWVKSSENGLHKIKEIAPLKMDVLYTPRDYHIVNNLRSNEIDGSTYEAEKERLGELQYYHLKLSISNSNGKAHIGNYEVQNIAEQQERLGYLSFGMKEDIYLLEQGDTLPCMAYHYEQAYDVKPHRSFLIAFAQREGLAKTDKTFVLDSPVFGTGPMKVQISSSDLLNIPDLKIKE